MRWFPGPRANPAPALCVYSPARRGCRGACFSEECWTYCQGRIPVWVLSLDRCRLENAIAQALRDCFPLLLALVYVRVRVCACVCVCVCVCARALAWWVVMERTSARGHGCGQSVEENLGSKLSSKLPAMLTSWRINLKSPEIISAQVEGEAYWPFLNLCVHIGSFKPGTQGNSTLDVN